MTTLDLNSAGNSFAGSTGDTEELAWELQQKRPDTHRIRWLIEDMGADVTKALAAANIREDELLKNPLLRSMGLQRHLKNRQ